MAGQKDQCVIRRHLHHLAGCEQRPLGFLLGDHDMAEPWGEPVAGIILLVALFGHRAEHVRDPLCRAFVIGREGDPDMAIVEDRIVLAISFLDLVQGLRDQEGPYAIPCHEGEGCLEEVQASKRGELVQHQQRLPPILPSGQHLTEPPRDLVEDQSDQGLGARQVRWRNNQVQGGGHLPKEQVLDPPVRA